MTSYMKDRLPVSYKPTHIFIIGSHKHTPKDFKTYVKIKCCTWMFIAVLFIIAKLGSNQDVLQ